MNGTTNPLYVAYMALHLANETLKEIPLDSIPDEVKEIYAANEDAKSNLWARLTSVEKSSVRSYNKDHQLA